MTGQIFISYRREDSSAWAGRLSDRLSNHFPSNQIFMDVDSVDLGDDFVKTIEKTVGSCDVLIAVIGKGWLSSSDQEEQRRLDNPEDFVRIEIATALKRDIRVIPVLVDGVSMPRSCDLPDDLKALVRRNALQLSHDRFRTDSERLASAVERALEKTAAERREREEKERLEAERGTRLPPEQAPEIGALFVLEAGTPKSRKPATKRHVHYKIRLYIRNAPSDTDVVTYKLHPTFQNPIREVRKAPESPECSLDIFSYGDFEITAEVRTSSRSYEINRRLSDALKAENDSPSPLERQALKEICEN
jgi:hypothetical protein